MSGPERKIVAKRPEAKKGGREEERHPELAARPYGAGRLRNKKTGQITSGQHLGSRLKTKAASPDPKKYRAVIL